MVGAGQTPDHSAGALSPAVKIGFFIFRLDKPAQRVVYL